MNALPTHGQNPDKHAKTRDNTGYHGITRVNPLKPAQKTPGGFCGSAGGGVTGEKAAGFFEKIGSGEVDGDTWPGSENGRNSRATSKRIKPNQTGSNREA
jgi:hypothetical protein